MRVTSLVHLLAAATAAISTTPAVAAEHGDLSVNGGATLTSDYRFRGISQTDRRVALQGSLTVAHESGLYATVWGSSIDDYVAAGADQEIDLILGYRRTLGDTLIDVGLLYYYYPGAESVVPGYASDFAEPYVSLSHIVGAVTVKATANYAPSQRALSVGAGNEDNLYLSSDLTLALPESLSLSAHVGHSFGPSYLTIGNGYTDWNLGIGYTRGPVTVSLQYVDTDGTFITPSGRNAAGGGIVASVGAAF